MSNINTLIQTKTQANSLIKTLRKTLDLNTLTRASTKWARAKILHELKNAVPWKLTKYKYFTHYRKAELEVSEMLIMQYIRAHDDLVRLGYSEANLLKLSKHFSFSSLSKIFKALPTKLSVTSIIKRYKDVPRINLEKLKTGMVLPININRFQLELNDDYMYRWHQILAPYGMQITATNRRIGATEALMALIDDLQP